jgi:uncharacterized protein (TIGR00251 family)
VIPLHETASGITFAVKVQPRASRDAVTGELGDALNISLAAPPVDGRANDACIDFLAELLEVPRSSITIVSGHSSRNKVMRVNATTAERISEKLRT